jgi:AcrR family transcriptional regulator
MSQRSVEDDVLLDAARDCVMAVGVRRTTFSDVARRAGVSRMTLYRRFPDVTTLIQALMTREFSAVLARAQHEAGELPTARERLVAAAIEGTDQLTRLPLFIRIVDVDPELLLPYLTTRLGQFQRAVLAEFERELQAGVEDGSIDAPDPALTARSIELALRGFAVATLSENQETLRDAELRQLRRMIDRSLRPEASE